MLANRLSKNSIFFELISVFYFEPKKKLVLMRMLDEYYVLGCSENSIQILLNLRKDKIEDCIKQYKASSSNGWNLLKRMCRKIMNLYKAEK